MFECPAQFDAEPVADIDLAIDKVRLFRLERMDNGAIWIRLYRENGDDKVIWLNSSSAISTRVEDDKAEAALTQSDAEIVQWQRRRADDDGWASSWYDCRDDEHLTPKEAGKRDRDGVGFHWEYRPLYASPPTSAGLIEALEQALDCIRGETPEDMSHEEARQDTIDKIRAALRARAADRSGHGASARPQGVRAKHAVYRIENECFGWDKSFNSEQAYWIIRSVLAQSDAEPVAWQWRIPGEDWPELSCGKDHAEYMRSRGAEIRPVFAASAPSICHSAQRCRQEWEMSVRSTGQKPTICYCAPGTCSAPKPEWCIGRRYADGFREPDPLEKRIAEMTVEGQSTPAMRARIRELARPNTDDYDRAVIAVLDDFENMLGRLQR